jgi:hypothetical protein
MIRSLKRYVKLILNLSERLRLIQNQAYQRMKSRKSLLASGILDSIKKFFESAEFAGSPNKILEYVLWALRPGGPAYYGVPTPQECRVKPNDSNYIVCASLLPLDTIADRLYITASQSFPGI